MRRRWQAVVALALALALMIAVCLVGCAPGRREPASRALAAAGASNYDASLVSGGMTRTYHVHLPPAVHSGKPLPLLLALHGHFNVWCESRCYQSSRSANANNGRPNW